MFRYLIAAAGLGGFLVSISAEEIALEDAEVRVPYAELLRLIEAAGKEESKTVDMAPALVSSRLALVEDEGGLTIEAEFRTARFGEGISRVALVGGDLSLEGLEPEGERLVSHGSMLCRIDRGEGASLTRARFRVASSGPGFELRLPPCPGTMIELAGLPDGRAVVLERDGTQTVHQAGGRIAMPVDGGRISLQVLDPSESSEVLRPPEPSTWSWQHQALVIPKRGELEYRILSHGVAADGSGVSARLMIPAEARGFTVDGKDLSSTRSGRDGEGNPVLDLKWSSRDVLEREFELVYRIPLRPLDERWLLQAPVGESDGTTRTRFILPASTTIDYEADGLSGAIDADSVDLAFAEILAGTPVHLIEADTSQEISIRRHPVVATADAMIGEASWFLMLEADGSMLMEGQLEIMHSLPQGVRFELPDGMKLLKCRVAGRSVDPVNRGEGVIEVAVPASDSKQACGVNLSFTGKLDSLDPLEGSLALALPRTPTFIRTLDWLIQMPAGYTSETSGNLARERRSGKDPEGSIRLRKRLCRDERPEVQVFYQSRNLQP
ncbi:MAG: hypothetical protein AAGB14_02055 [Verrucomicrobiota bacterium]